MPENMETLFYALIEGDDDSRTKAAQVIAGLSYSNKEIVRALEYAVVHNPSPTVQTAILAALAAPIHHVQQRRLTVATYERHTILHHIDEWTVDGLIPPYIAELIRGRYVDLPPAPAPTPPKPEPVQPVSVPAAPKVVEAHYVHQPILEKQKFSLIGTLTSEMTIKIALYLGAFLIVAAAVIFAGLVEPVRFPMLTSTIAGFLTAANISNRRKLPLGSFVLFIIGTLLIPIDTAVFFALINIQASSFYWAIVAAGMSIVWGWGIYFYHSRILSLVVFASFSLAVYLVATSYVEIESAGFLLVVSLVALAGLGEAAVLRRWQGESFFEPIFDVAQIQTGMVLFFLGILLLSQVSELLAWIVDHRHLSGTASRDITLLVAWLTVGGFYITSERLTRHRKKWSFPVFPLLVTICLATPPILISRAIEANPHQIAAILWGWGALAVVASEGFYGTPVRSLRPYAPLCLYASILFLATAPLVEWFATPDYAVGYFMATSVVYFVAAYRRKQPMLWIVALIAVYLGYMTALVHRVGIDNLDSDKSTVFVGFALMIPVVVFLSIELAGRRVFRATSAWALPPLILGLFNLLWDIMILLSWYGNHSASGTILCLFYAAFGVIYAALDDQPERKQAVTAWTASLIAMWGAYLYALPSGNHTHFFGYIPLIPALVFLSAELLAKRYLKAGLQWTQPLLGMGLFNVAVGVLLTLIGGMNGHPGSASIVFLIYGLFGIFYAVVDAPLEHDYAIIAWAAGLIALYAAYDFLYMKPAIDIFPGYFLLLPTLVFLSAELVAKLHFKMHPHWTLPLLGLGLLNAALVASTAFNGGMTDTPGSAVIIFLIYGLFAMLYMALDAREHVYAVTAWTTGLIALYAAYGFLYRLPAIEDLNIFSGYFLLLPALIFLLAELAGRLYYQLDQEWTLPLFGLGLFNAALVVPVTLDGGLYDAPGSAMIIFLIYGLFAALYAILTDRSELGYLATSSITISLGFALLFLDQDRWMVPFTALALLYYLGGLSLLSIYEEHHWSQVLYWSGLALGTVTALSGPMQGGGDAAACMSIIATLYGAEAFRRRSVWPGIPANALFLGAYFLALQELNISQPQFYSIGTSLLAIATHYLLTRRSDEQAAFAIGFVTGVTAQIILLGTSFIQMDAGLQFFFVLFFQSLVLLAYGVTIHSLSFIIVPILFVVGAVLRVVFTFLASYSTVVTIGCTGFALILLGITALIMRERLIKTFQQAEN